MSDDLLIEYGGNVLAREGIGGVRNQQAGLTYGSVSNNYALDGLHVSCSVRFFVSQIHSVFFKRSPTCSDRNTCDIGLWQVKNNL
jgi:hypothetical protein